MTKKTTPESIKTGIKTIAVGKKGSKSISAELAKKISSDLKDKGVPEVAQGAFFGALCIKGVTNDEKLLSQGIGLDSLDHHEQLVDKIAPNVPEFVKLCCVRLLNHETLNKEEAHQLGQFLFSEEPGDGARGMVASILRVRYETPDEYEGLLTNLHETFEAPFTTPPQEGHPIIQIAEPFDGVDHSNLITPLIANYLQSLNYRVVSQVGRNSGPKFGNNLLDVATGLDASFLKGNEQLSDEQPNYGWYIHQSDLSKAMDRWVDLRHLIIKRPFMSTIERFVNPLKADILIASAFHPPYGEKMLTIAERVGFPKAIIIRNGLEGTIEFPLKRNAKILCSKKQEDGQYQRLEFDFDPKTVVKEDIPVEEKLDNPVLEKNVELIKQYHQNGHTDYDLFNWRTEVTCAGIKEALNWLHTE